MKIKREKDKKLKTSRLPDQLDTNSYKEERRKKGKKLTGMERKERRKREVTIMQREREGERREMETA